MDYGTVYTPDLARYAAIAATTLPDTELNSIVDIGWSTPVNSESLANAFSKVLNRPIKAGPSFPPVVMKMIMPMLAMFITPIRDMVEMMRWVETGAYVSKNPGKQKAMFDDLPTIEEAVTRYCVDHNLIQK